MVVGKGEINMALGQAKIQPTITEKRYMTIQFLEAAFVSGNRVQITPVTNYNVTNLSGEQFTYGTPIETYIIYDDRPKVSLLKSLGWYREDDSIKPQIAQIATHLIYRKSDNTVINELLLVGDEFQQLVQTGESASYILKPLQIARGTLIDVYYDFAPTKINRFYVVEPKLDTVSINYTCNIMPYKYQEAPKGTEEQNPANGMNLNFNSDNHGL